MQADMPWLRGNFRQFNERYFGGALPEPRFRIGRARTRLGSLTYRRAPAGSGAAGDFTLTVSNHYDLTEWQLRNVLLHEMIHLSIAASGQRDTAPHGALFRAMMRRLNGEGWGISVTAPVGDAPRARGGDGRPCLVLAVVTARGHFLSAVSPRAATSLDRRLRRLRRDGAVSSYAWYTSADKWFEDMPRVRSLRGRRVDGDTFRTMVEAMEKVSL